MQIREIVKIKDWFRYNSFLNRIAFYYSIKPKNFPDCYAINVPDIIGTIHQQIKGGGSLELSEERLEERIVEAKKENERLLKLKEYEEKI